MPFVADVLQRWMKQLKRGLLSKKMWGGHKSESWKAFVDEITALWVDPVTKQERLIPKHHMLLHVLPFAVQHCALGRVSEASIERHHAEINDYLRNHFFNTRAPSTACIRSWSGHPQGIEPTTSICSMPPPA